MDANGERGERRGWGKREATAKVRVLGWADPRVYRRIAGALVVYRDRYAPL